MLHGVIYAENIRFLVTMLEPVVFNPFKYNSREKIIHILYPQYSSGKDCPQYKLDITISLYYSQPDNADNNQISGYQII